MLYFLTGAIPIVGMVKCGFEHVASVEDAPRIVKNAEVWSLQVSFCVNEGGSWPVLRPHSIGRGTGSRRFHHFASTKPILL